MKRLFLITVAMGGLAACSGPGLPACGDSNTNWVDCGSELSVAAPSSGLGTAVAEQGSKHTIYEPGPGYVPGQPSSPPVGEEPGDGPQDPETEMPPVGEPEPPVVQPKVGQNPGNNKPVGNAPFDGERGEEPSGKSKGKGKGPKP
jgi:hypothetical protein